MGWKTFRETIKNAAFLNPSALAVRTGYEIFKNKSDPITALKKTHLNPITGVVKGVVTPNYVENDAIEQANIARMAAENTPEALARKAAEQKKIEEELRDKTRRQEQISILTGTPGRGGTILTNPGKMGF